MPRTGTRSPRAVRGFTAPGFSIRHSEVSATAPPAPAASSATALVRAMSAPISAPAAIGPASCPSEAPMVKCPKLRSCSWGADWRATSDCAPITKHRCPRPITPLHSAMVHSDPATPLSAQPAEISTTPVGSSGAQRPWSVRRPSGTAANSGSSA